MDALRVPFGLNERGEVVSPKDAKKGEAYACPGCSSQLTLRQGEIKVAHFAHRVDVDCNQETILHKSAKALIGSVIIQSKKGLSEAPIVVRCCCECGKQFPQRLSPAIVYDAIEECPVGKFVVDILILGSGGARLAAVEIRVTHAVDMAKAAQLEIPFVELAAEDVILDPLHWRPLLDRFPPAKCSSCIAYEKTNQRRGWPF